MRSNKYSLLSIFASLAIGLLLGGALGASIVYYYKTRPLSADTQLRVLTYGFNIPKTLTDKFLTKQKIQILQDQVHSNFDLLERLNDRSHEYDIVVLYSWQTQTFIHSQLLAPIKKNLVPNLRFIAADFKHMPHDKELIYSSPIGWGVNGIIYNQKRIKERPTSWSSLLNEKSYDGKIALLAEPREIMAGLIRRRSVATANDSSNGSGDSENESANLYLKAFEEILPLAKNPTQRVLKKLGQGDLWAAELPNGMVSPLMSHSDDFAFIVPEESATLWTLSLSPCRGSNKTKESHRFMDFLLSKDAALELSQNSLLATPLISLEYENIHPTLKPSYIRTLPLNRLQVIEPVNQMAKQWESTVIEKTAPLN